MDSPERPTHPRLHIRDAKDAQTVMEAVRLGILRHVSRRLNESERAAYVRSGSVFVWEESDDDLGLKRWTDGLFWTQSRMKGPFLFYEEKARDEGSRSASNSIASSQSLEVPSRAGLVKQSYTAYVQSPYNRVRKWHLTAYRTDADVPNLPTIDDDPLLKAVVVPRSVFHSGKARSRQLDIQDTSSGLPFAGASSHGWRSTAAWPDSSPHPVPLLHHVNSASAVTPNAGQPEAPVLADALQEQHDRLAEDQRIISMLLARYYPSTM